MPSQLEVDRLSAGYGETKVIHDLSFDVSDGEIVTLLGANGAGKTTTLRALTGMIRAEGGLRFQGRPAAGMAPHAIARLGVAHVPDGRGTFSDFSVEQNLQAGAWTLPRGKFVEQRERMFRLFPRLQERRTQLAGTLSGGEQQMLAIARALMMRPRLLLLDEPSFGVAPMVVAEIFAQLQQINRNEGTALLLVEQNAALALKFSHRALLLENGRLVRTAPCSELMRDESIRRAYLGEITERPPA